MGDLLDAICYRDKRFDPMGVHPRHREHYGDIFRHQLKTVKKKIAPLKDHIVGCHTGNHETSCSKYFQYDPHAELLETFGFRDLKWSALTKITVKCGKKKLYDFVVFSTHAMGNLTTMLSFKNRTKHIRADIKMQGHNHKLEFARVNEIEHRDDVFEDGIDDDPAIWGFVGSYYRTYCSGIVGYGEIRGYDPVPLGCLNLLVREDPERPGKLEFEAKTT